MGFGDFLDKALSKAGSKISNVSSMTSKLDSFKSNFSTYSNAKLPTGLGAFQMAMAGGESKSITSGIPSLDEAIAEEAGGLFDTVASGIGDLIGDEYTEAFEAGVAAAGGVANVMETAGGLVSNFESLGQGLAGEGFQSLATMAQDFIAEKADAKANMINFKKMFGLKGADIRAMAGGTATDALVNKLADRMAKVDFVTSVPIDMAAGRPSIGSFIDGKYPDLASGMPDVGGAVNDALPNISDPIRSVVDSVGNAIANIPDINRFGDVMGNAAGDTTEFLSRSMSKIDNVLTTGTTRLQTDFFGNLPSTTEAAKKMLPGITSKVLTGIPNPPTVTNAITTEMPNLSPQIEAIVTDISSAIDAVPGYSGTSSAMIAASMPQIDTLLATTAQDLQRENGEFPPVQVIVDAALPQIELIVSGNLPGLPAVKTVVQATTESVSGQISGAMQTLATDILTIPGIGDPYDIYQQEFIEGAFIATSNVLLEEMGELVNIEVPELKTTMQPLITTAIYNQVPVPPTVGSVQTALNAMISEHVYDLLVLITPELELADTEIDGVENTLEEINTITSGGVATMETPVTSSYTQLQDDYDVVDALRDIISDVVTFSVPDINDILDVALPIAQATLPDVTGYLNEAAGELMDDIRGNIPAFDEVAQAGFANMVDFAQNLATQKLGGLTDAATSMLASVNIPISIPDIGSMQIATAMKTTMFNIEAIQNAQYGLDMMEKAKSMIPEIESALASYENFSWEGSGFSLGAIGSYFSDIGSTEDMGSIVAGALEGAPPIQQCSAKIAGAISQANSVKATIESKKAEAEAAIDTIKSFFS